MNAELSIGEYSVEKNCWNCGNNNIFVIKKGVKVDDFLDKNMCKRCGCHVRSRDVVQEKSE